MNGKRVGAGRWAMGAMLTLLGTIGFNTFGQGASPRTIDLRPKFEKGQEIRYEMRTESTSTYSAGAQGGLELDGKSGIQQQLDLVLKVIESDPETGSKLELVVERVAARIDNDGQITSFDSAKPARGTPSDDTEGPIGAFKSMVGSSVLIEIDPNGTITSLSAPTSLPGANSFSALTNAGIGNLMSIQGGIGLPFGELVSMGHPTGLVKPREEWTNRDRLGGLGMTMVTTHRMRSASGNSARVEFSGKIERPTEATGGPADAMEKGIQGFEFEGDYDWDVGKGQLNKMNARSEFRLDREPLVFETRMVSSVRRVR